MKIFYFSAILIATPLAALTVDGTPDQTFGFAGYANIPFTTARIGRTVHSLATDDLIIGAQVAVGQSSLLKLKKDGSLDTAYGNNGRADVAIAATLQLTTVMQPDESVIIAAVEAGQLSLTRVLPTGFVDTRFANGSTGIAATQQVSMGLQTDGAIIVAYQNGTDVFLSRFFQNGQVDADFGQVQVGATVGTLNNPRLCIDNHNRIVISCGVSAANSIVVFRYSSTGELDTQFGVQQGVTTIGNLDAAFNRDVVINRQGDIRLVCDTTIGTNWAVIGLDERGLLQSWFGQQGIVRENGLLSSLLTLLIQADGKIVGVGVRTATTGIFLTRYLYDGTVDQSFGINGRITGNFPGAVGSGFLSGAIDSDNNIVAVGEANNPIGLIAARYAVNSLESSLLSAAIWDRYYNQNNR